MKLDLNNYIVFFILVSFMYVFSPAISAVFFLLVPEGLLEFTVIGLLLITIVIFFKIMTKRWFYLKPIYINAKYCIIFGCCLLLSLLYFLKIIYGSFESAVFQSYNSRTGVSFTGLVGSLYYPLIVTISGYISLVLSELFFFKSMNRTSRYFSALIAITLLFIFLGSGNRNIVLWSLSLPIAIYVGIQSKFKVMILVTSMIFLSVIMAAMRNNGFGSIATFTFPEYAYWNPIVHEYGTTYRVYDLVINDSNNIDGYEIFGQSYLDTIINLLPSFLKPDGFVSFSDSLSRQYGVNGEGLGNSPIAEVIYNGYFPSVLIQAFPFLFIFIILFSKIKGFVNKYLYVLKVALLGCFFIASFNFWRIGNAELSKIMLSYCFGLIVSYLILTYRFRRIDRG